MVIEATCPTDDCPTLGVEAVDLGRYVDVLTEDGGLLLYDRREGSDAWIESDLYHPRASCV